MTNNPGALRPPNGSLHPRPNIVMRQMAHVRVITVDDGAPPAGTPLSGHSPKCRKASSLVPALPVSASSSQVAYRFPTCGPFLWKLGAFWRPFSFRARYDRGATQSCLE